MGAAKNLFVYGQKPQELDYRGFVVVHAQVDEAIVASGIASVFSGHQQCGGLPAA